MIYFLSNSKKGRIMKIVFLMLIAVIGMTSCNTDSKRFDGIVEKADWKQMKEVTISLSEYSYTPSALTFMSGKPYKLSIKNTGTEKHYFTAPEFFQNCAARKVQSNSDGEIKADFFKALEVFPGRSLDYYFVPVTTGIYKLNCTMKGHTEKGMCGTITVK